MRIVTGYSLVLHWHQMSIASIWGDMQILPLAACGLWIPSSRATPAWVAIPPLLLFLIIITFIHFWLIATYGFKQGEGFFVSSIKPAIFLRKRLCMFFSSISLSFMLSSACTCPLVIFCIIYYYVRVTILGSLYCLTTNDGTGVVGILL